MNNLSWILAVISIILSIITLYYSFLRPAKLKIYIGPYLIISKQDSYFAFNVPFTFANKSNQTGVIQRCSMIITRIQKPQANYFMLWKTFRKLNANGDSWIQGDSISSIAVIAKSTEYRNIEFTWPFDTSTTLKLEEGDYQLHFHFWSIKSKLIANLKHEINIKSNDEKHFADPNIVGKIRLFSIDNTMKMNEILNQSQVEKLKKLK